MFAAIAVLVHQAHDPGFGGQALLAALTGLLSLELGHDHDGKRVVRGVLRQFVPARQP